MCALYGVSADEMKNVTAWDSLDEQGRLEFADHIEGIKVHGGNREDVDVLFWRHDGTSLWVLISEIEIRDDSGAVVGFTHRISDYSGRRRALDALQESRAQLAIDDQLAALSRKGEVRPIENTTHYIQLQQPELVIEAIRQVVEGVRHPDTWDDLTSCCAD